MSKQDAIDKLLTVCDDIVKYGDLETSGGAGMYRDLVEALRDVRRTRSEV